MRKNPKKMNKKLVMLTSIFIVALFIGTNCSTATTVDSFSNSIEKESKVEAEKTAALFWRFRINIFRTGYSGRSDRDISSLCAGRWFPTHALSGNPYDGTWPGTVYSWFSGRGDGLDER